MLKTLLSLFLFIAVSTFAQEPSYFKIGEKELSGVNVYDIFHDDAGDYWIATNNGLYKYDCYEFKSIPIENKKGNSAFSFKTNSFGELFCHNFAGQIFRITNDTAKVFFELKAEDMSQYVQYAFNEKDELLILSKNLLRVDNSRNLISRSQNTKGVSRIFSFEGKIYGVISQRNGFDVVMLDSSKNGFKRHFEHIEYGASSEVAYDNNIIFYDPQKGTYIGSLRERPYSVNYSWEDSESTEGRIFQGKNDLWVLKTKGGFYRKSNPEKLCFSETFISVYYEDAEGNIILGTFGDGIIVIPNFKVQNITIANGNKKITKICTDGTDLYAGTNKGEVYKIENENVRLIYDEGVKQIELLEYMSFSNSLVLNSPVAIEFNLETKKWEYTKSGSVKSVNQISENKYVFSAGSGLYTYGLDEDGSRVGEYITNFRTRGYSADYDRINELFYVGTVNGLKVGNSDTAWFYKHNGQDVICYDIKTHKNKMFVATNGHGILIFKDKKVVEQWNIESGLPSNFIKQIKIQNDKIYGTSEKGFFEANSNGKILRTLTIADGLNSNNIADFEIIDDQLWLVSNNRLQKISLNSIKTEPYTPTLNYLRVFQNDELVSAINDFELKTRFSFEFASKTLRHKEDISYRYQLVGIDANWINVSHQTRKVEYKSLPAGEYEFQVEVNYENYHSDPLTYSFNVLNPFWMRTWFFITCGVTFILIVLLIYFVQRKRYRLKIEIKQNLAKSQLSTLKSQMNPHFIFNSLSSVQDLILQEKKEGAYKYISKFAMLVRKTLNQSDQEFIELEEELSLLTIYLELEQLRFKKHFSYEINAHEIEDIEIPPMLIQPIVENAIKHGLLHKKGEKSLSVNYSLNNALLTCVVKDNGIGRTKAIEIKKRKKHQNKSFAMNSIESRFDLLKSIYGGDLGIEYIDHQLDGKPTGTEVVVKIPYRHKF